ncbi:MAG: 1-deoxy-D-xylulose-5-phosphate reductoisomerase [Actinomycetota bacterium]|nr:MAG: 1-deoxy-D-xylulose-5-phosphate reductoisomerase [Actinomycetota bacterium]
MVQVSIAGSTGSVGTQALDVISANRSQFDLSAIFANSNIDLLASQANSFRPGIVGLGKKDLVNQLIEKLSYSPQVVAGDEALVAMAEAGDVVLNAVVGFAGLPVTISALELGKRLALANKESLVAAGDLVAKVRGSSGGEIIPVDSEHSAIHQALRSSFFSETEVSKIVLTASGGPFRGKGREFLSQATPQQALAHPTWSMGPKISIDSSTLMNKGLEVIEAHELFGIGFDKIEVVVHPQSIVHSIVEFTDGSALAQISGPDMRLPIGYALGYPSRLKQPFGALDWRESRILEFEAPDLENFPSLPLAYEAGRRGGGAPAWLSAANEVGVDAFLVGEIGWTDIFKVVEASFEKYEDAGLDSIEDVLETDFGARRATRSIIENL